MISYISNGRFSRLHTFQDLINILVFGLVFSLGIISILATAEESDHVSRDLDWEYYLGNTESRSSPAIGADGTIYVGSFDRHLYAINPDGSLLWRSFTNSFNSSSPSVASDGTIYLGAESESNNDRRLYAFNPDGSPKWSYITGENIFSSPSIGSDGTIYIGSGSNNIYAINQSGPGNQ